MAADADLSLNCGKDNDALMAYRKAKKQSGRKRREEKGSRMGEDKVKRDGRRNRL